MAVEVNSELKLVQSGVAIPKTKEFSVADSFKEGPDNLSGLMIAYLTKGFRQNLLFLKEDDISGIVGWSHFTGEPISNEEIYTKLGTQKDIQVHPYHFHSFLKNVCHPKRYMAFIPRRKVILAYPSYHYRSYGYIIHVQPIGEHDCLWPGGTVIFSRDPNMELG